MAPDRTTFSTQNTGANGNVITSEFWGTSAAAPHIAGLAALVKDQYLAAGNSWINSPGWLFTVMLGSADRYYEPTSGTLSTKTSGYDKKYGAGKVRLRLLGTGGGLGTIGTEFYTLNFVSGGSTWSTTLWPGDFPTGTDVVKCVLFQNEDMSGGKTEISDIDLKLELYQRNIFGTCSPLGALVTTRYDNSLDNKSMVAFDSSDTTLATRCAKLTVTPYYVTSAGVTTRTMCYFATTRDGESPL